MATIENWSERGYITPAGFVPCLYRVPFKTADSRGDIACRQPSILRYHVQYHDGVRTTSPRCPEHAGLQLTATILGITPIDTDR